MSLFAVVLLVSTVLCALVTGFVLPMRLLLCLACRNLATENLLELFR